MESEEEIEVLLGEIPRATSVCQQLCDYQTSPGSPLPLANRKLTVSQSDPLPLPLPDDLSDKHLPSFLSDSCAFNLDQMELPSDTPLFPERIRHSTLQADRESLQQRSHLQAFESSPELNDEGLRNQIPQEFPYDEECIRSTLANLSFQDDPKPLPDDANDYTNCGNRVAPPRNFLVESLERGTLRKSSPSHEPFGNGSFFPVENELISAPSVQKLQRSTVPKYFDWNSTVQATRVDLPSMRYFQAQQSSFEEPDLPQHSKATTMPVLASKFSAPRRIGELDLHGNGFRVGASQGDLRYDDRAIAYRQQQKLQPPPHAAVGMRQQQFQQSLLPPHQMLEQQPALYASLHNQVGGPLGPTRYFNYLSAVSFPGFPQQSSDQQHQAAIMAATLQTIRSQSDTSSIMGLADHGNQCRCYAQGHCLRGDACPFFHLHGCTESGVAPWFPQNALAGAIDGQDERPGTFVPSKTISQRSLQSNGDHAAVGLGRRRKDLARNGHQGVPSLADKPGGQRLVVLDDHGIHLSPQLMKLTTLDELEGRIYNVAKDQHGCRFLQRKFDEGKREDVCKIFEEIRGHIVELMTDPFGNYLVQKLLDVCNEAHLMEILDAVTQNDELLTISLNMHGTRAIQKLIERLQTPEQVSLVILSLKKGVVTLIKDLNGNHVVQRCLQRLGIENNQFIFDAAASHCVEIASHRHGCCVLQRCVDSASGLQRQYLVAEIAANALVLSQDPFGNYVVQYILELGLPWASAEVMSRLEGSYPHLAMQKFSSNVVEKCLKLATENSKAFIVKELIASSVLGELLQDPYANYVVQSALQVTKGPLHISLVDAIRPHVSALRSSPYGKRVLSHTHLKK